MLKSRYALLKPRCRFCDREWVPPTCVSANLAFCMVCQDDRTSLAREQQGESKSAIGLNGELRLVPTRLNAGR